MSLHSPSFHSCYLIKQTSRRRRDDDDESGHSDDGDGPGEVSIVPFFDSYVDMIHQDSDELSPLDRELARNRQMLEQKYGNDGDNSFSYVDPVTGQTIQLTPFMLKEWARAMVLYNLLVHSYSNHHFQYDNLATLAIPPNTTTFDPLTRLPSLRNTRRQSTSPSDSAPKSDIGYLAQIIEMTRNGPPPRPTSTPTHPMSNTPGSLRRFLAYAESQLGVSNAQQYREILEADKIGPDILDRVPDDVLAKKDIPFGDILRLKHGSSSWVDGPNNDDDDDLQRPAKKIRFEKQFIADDGRQTVWGDGMQASNGSPPHDFRWYYFCHCAERMLPLPNGFEPIEEVDEFDDFN
jgi:hypothetical protein